MGDPLAVNRRAIAMAIRDKSWAAANALIEQRVRRGWPLDEDDHLRDPFSGELLSEEAERAIFVKLMELRDA